MEIRTTKILLFPLPNITNELADLISIPIESPPIWIQNFLLAWLHIAEDSWPYIN